MIPIFVGYDSNETTAYHVCTNSIIRQCSRPISITPLALGTLNNYNEVHTDGSSEFAYTRFLVPVLMNYTGWAIFIDGDMILNDDIVNLWKLKDNDKAVMVVQHNYKTCSEVKYLNFANKNYPRKNWSSVVLWNCAHPANRVLTTEFVQNSAGSVLHRFTWLDDALIGELPATWNWLADEYGTNPDAKLIHYTLGTPCFDKFKNTPMSEYWHREHQLTNHCQKPS